MECTSCKHLFMKHDTYGCKQCDCKISSQELMGQLPPRRAFYGMGLSRFAYISFLYSFYIFVFSLTTVGEKNYQWILLIWSGLILTPLLGNVFWGRHWYNSNYSQYWSEKRRNWHARHSKKFFRIFTIAIVVHFSISILYLYESGSIVEINQVSESSYDYSYEEWNDRIEAGYRSFKLNNSLK